VAILIKEAAWVFWIPAGAINSELEHYRSAETIRLAKRFVRDRASYTEKDVSVLEEYARLRDDRVPVRTATDRRSFDRALVSSGSEQVLVRYEGGGQMLASAPGYYVVLGQAQALMARMDIRWRWVGLRLLNASFLLMAAWLTYLGGRFLFPHHQIPALTGAIVVGYGPWAGLGGSLIGPGAATAALWAAWFWQFGYAARRQAGWSLPWLGMIAFALSSFDVSGFLAALCTLGGALFLKWRRMHTQLWPPLLACLLSLACLVFWIYRFTRFEPVVRSIPLTVSDFVFGSSGFVVSQPPGWIAFLSAIVGALVLAGALLASIRRSIPLWSVLGALGLSLIVPAFSLVQLGHTGGLLTISPVLGLLSAAAVSVLRTRVAYGVSLLLAVLAVTDFGLLMWWIQRGLS
jgi:hypothetical protein